MEIKIEYTLPEGEWAVTIDGVTRKFTNRTYALIYINNQTLTMIAEEEK